MSVMRWDQDGFPDQEGMFILYSDSLAAVAEAEQRGREAVARMWDADKETSLGRSIAAYDRGYEQAKYDLRLMLPDAYEQGYWDGYEQGYDSALSHHVCETGFVEAPESGFDWPTNFNQHGTGENP